MEVEKFTALANYSDRQNGPRSIESWGQRLQYRDMRVIKEMNKSPDSFYHALAKLENYLHL